MRILDGRQTSLKISTSVKEEVSKYISEGKRVPRLDVLLVGDDFGSSKYVGMKSKKAKELGIQCEVHRYGEDVQKDELISKILELNEETLVDGIMVQLPLPKHINENEILEYILPSKDVDGLTSVNLGKLFKNDPTAIPAATARGVMELLKEYEIQVEGKNAVVINRSSIVGLPIVALLQNENATVTICHSYTQNLKDICKCADILVVGIGKAEYITSEYIKQGSTVIDVGINRNSEGKLVGDVDYSSVKEICEYITPVPGGVGPMTIVSLFSNLFNTYKNNV